MLRDLFRGNAAAAQARFRVSFPPFYEEHHAPRPGVGAPAFWLMLQLSEEHVRQIARQF